MMVMNCKRVNGSMNDGWMIWVMWVMWVMMCRRAIGLVVTCMLSSTVPTIHVAMRIVSVWWRWRFNWVCLFFPLFSELVSYLILLVMWCCVVLCCFGLVVVHIHWCYLTSFVVDCTIPYRTVLWLPCLVSVWWMRRSW